MTKSVSAKVKQILDNNFSSFEDKNHEAIQEIQFFVDQAADVIDDVVLEVRQFEERRC